MKKPSAVTLTASTPAPPGLLVVPLPKAIELFVPFFVTAFSMLIMDALLREEVIPPAPMDAGPRRLEPIDSFEDGIGGTAERLLLPDPMRRCLPRQAVGGDRAGG